MHGQLYQECEAPGCNTEPVCAGCFKCERHCTCDAEAKEIKAFHDERERRLNTLLHGMVEISCPGAVGAGATIQVGEKVDFSTFGGGVYKIYTPVLYTIPDLAGQYGVHYWYYIGGDDAIVTDKFWVATPDEAPARKAAADAWLAAKAVKDAAEKVRQQEQQARWEKERAAKEAAKAVKDAAAADLKAKYTALVPRLATMTKPAIIAEIGSLLNDKVVAPSWSKAKIIEAITKHVAGGCVVPRKPEKYVDQYGPDCY